MIDPAPDTLSLDELARQAQEAVDFLRELTSNDAAIFSSKEGEQQQSVTEEAAGDVDQASGGVITSEDYAANNAAPSTSHPQATVFEKVLDQAKLDLMNIAKENLNAFTHQAIKKSIELIDDLDAILGDVVAQALKIQVAYAAGLIIPPDRREVQELKEDAQKVKDETENSIAVLDSALSRREAARKALGGNEGTGEEPNLNPVSGRFVQPQPGISQQNRQDPFPVRLSLAASSSNDQSIPVDINRRGRASEPLTESTNALQGSVLEKISYIAICAAINNIDSLSDQSKNLIDKFERLKDIVDQILESMGAGFLNNLKDQLQEGVIDQLRSVSEGLQGKLQAFDTFLSTGLPQLPTIVRTVDAVGDTPEDLPALESIAGQCNLKIKSFCDAQGLLEIAKTIDAELGIIQPRAPAFARVRLVLQAPEAEIRPPAVLPDLEANMILVGALEGETSVDYVGPNATHVVARFPRANIRSELSAPVPDLSGALAEDADAGAETLLVSGLPENIATLGNVTINIGPEQQVLRYSSFETEGANVRFTLIDNVSAPGAGALGAVLVTGEQRNSFQGAFEPNRAIKGGPGRLALAGDGETRQQLDYESSSFDASNGEYTFVIDTDATPLSPSAPQHKFQLLCRPHQTKKTILYKDMGLGAILQTGRRFKVYADGRIYALEQQSPFNIDATFDWSANGTYVIDDPADYQGAGIYRLLVGKDNVPYEVQEFNSDAEGNYALLTMPYALGDQERVTLSRILKQQEPGSSTVRLKLDRRQQDDIRVRDLAEGATADISGRVVVDGGGATTMVGGFSEEITSTATPTLRQTITSKSPIVRGDEADMPNGGARIDVLSGRSYFSSRIISSNAASKQVTFELPQGPGTVSIAAVGNTRAGYYTSGDLVLLQGSSTQFLSDFQIADYVYVDGAPRRILEVRNNLEIIVTSPFSSVASGLDYHKCAPNGPTAVGANGQSFTIQRQPREDLEFTAITRVDDGVPGLTSPFFDLTLSSPTQFAHELQEPEVPATVKIIPQDEFNDFRASFSDPAVSVTPRFDGTIIPPGTTTLRAVFQEPAQESIFSDLVLQASKIILTDALKTEISVDAGTTVDDGVYSFSITTNPLVFPLEDGDVIEVETAKSVFDALEEIFPGDWNNPFDEFLSELVEKIRLLESKICRILGGRPMDVAVTSLAISAAASAIRLSFLLPTKLYLQGLLLGLTRFPVIEKIIKEFEESGMDAAARVLENGDIVSISQLDATNSTAEGRALQALSDFREVVAEPNKIKILENAKAIIRGLELDKEILAKSRRPYKEIASDKLGRQEETAENLSLDVEVATS